MPSVSLSVNLSSVLLVAVCSDGLAESKGEAGGWGLVIAPQKGAFLGGRYRASHCNQWDLLHSCVKVCEAIELPFGMVSGAGRLGPGIGVLDGGPHPQRKGGFGGGVSCPLV